jgi:L-threonylcarbamoyladenylate synthase
MALSQQLLNQTKIAVQQGGVIAYPTEGVFGLGCDPFNEAAVHKLLALKQRPLEKGLIIVAATWQQVADLCAAVPSQRLQAVLTTWPGAITWLFPASDCVPRWISGGSSSIALRISAHPIVQALTQELGPLVSTSANISNAEAALTAMQVKEIFTDNIDVVIEAEVGGLHKATPILDALTGEIIRD